MKFSIILPLDLFIAGTYMPIFVSFGSRCVRMGTLFGSFGLWAALGVLFNALLCQKIPSTLYLLYIIMGWLIVLAWKPLQQHLSGNGPRC